MRGTQPLLLRSSVRGSLAVVAIAVMLGLSGCSVSGPSTSVTSPVPSSAPGGSSASPGVTPSLHPDGSAEDNLPLFSAVVAQVWAGEGRVSGRAYVDALTSAGFARADMQVTADESTVGNPAESIQFSVRWGGSQCLVGQVGPSTGDPVTAVLPQVDGGRCLIGQTASIEP